MEVTVLWKWASRFDRSIKRAETLEEYIQNCPFFNAPGNVSFDLADGVSTSTF